MSQPLSENLEGMYYSYTKDADAASHPLLDEVPYFPYLNLRTYSFVSSFHREDSKACSWDCTSMEAASEHLAIGNLRGLRQFLELQVDSSWVTSCSDPFQLACPSYSLEKEA